MSFIRSRLRRIEGATRSGPCRECKLPPDGPGFTVYARDGLPEDLDERCRRCGRRLWFVVEAAMPGTAPDPGVLSWP